ncbi:hypothetical protein CHUAL_009291 [Chamberlinius hualienensis]
MDDTESTNSNTSIDDKNDDFNDSSNKHVLAEGLMCLFKPAVEKLDERVKSTRMSQIELRQQIESLAEDLCRISEAQNLPFDLNTYVKKLMNVKRRIMLVNNILQNTQDRLNRLQQNAKKEGSRRKALLDQSSTSLPAA